MQPNDRKHRVIIAVAGAAVALVMMGSFFWTFFKDFLHAQPNGGPGSKVPLLVVGGFFLVMILMVLANVVRAIRQPQNPPASRPATATSGGIAGPIFLVLFSLPFAGFGLFALVQAVRKMSAGNWKDAAVFGLFGLVFAAVGFGLMLSTVWARKKARQLDELKSRQPDQPWLWRADWAAGKIKSSATAPVKFFLLWSVLALALSAPAVWHLPQEWQKGNHMILLVLIFPVVAVALLGYAFAKWRSRRRFGDCHFEMASIPGALGGTLEGLIQTGARLRLEHGLHLKLSCIRVTVSGSGENQSRQESVLWQDEKIFKSEAGLPEPEPGRSGIPVFFKLPTSQPECGDGIFWRLEAKAKMSGPDFSAVFDVPVFKVAGAAVAETDEPDPTASLQMPVEELRRDEHSKIQVTNRAGGREFYFPAARNLGVAFSMTVAVLAFGGFAVAARLVFHSLFFPIAFGLVSLFVFISCINFWFKSSRVTINSSGVTLLNRWLFLCRKRDFSASNIGAIEAAIGMTSGNQAFYNLRLVLRGNKKTTIASGITSKPEADWLVQEMTKALGLKSKTL